MKSGIFLLIAILIGSEIGCTSKTQSPKSLADTITAVKPPETKKMIIARVWIKPGKEIDFINAAKQMIENSNKEPGCESYMLYQDPYEISKFIFIETYKNQAAIDIHFASPYFKAFGPKINEWLSQSVELKIYDIAGVK